MFPPWNWTRAINLTWVRFEHETFLRWARGAYEREDLGRSRRPVRAAERKYPASAPFTVES